MQKKKLIIDFDDTLVESIFLQRVNRFLKTKYTFDDFDNYYIDDIIPVDKRKEFFDSFCDTNPYLDVKFVSGAQQAVKKLNELYDIYICSGCVINNMPSKSAQIFAYKYDFLIKNFPFLSPKKFIFTNSKEIIKADIMIDDYLHNLKTFDGQRLLFASYHNKNFTKQELDKLGIIRVNNWEEVCKILL